MFFIIMKPITVMPENLFQTVTHICHCSKNFSFNAKQNDNANNLPL